MSETPVPYGMTQRVEALERQIAQIVDVQAQNANAIGALVNAIDRLRLGMDTRLVAVEARLTGMENQLSALNQSNQLLADLLAERLPPPTTE